MPQPYRTTRLVEFHDTDMAGIMHFASFFHYMESAEHELIRSLGFSVHLPIDDQTISFPRVAAAAQYTSPVRSEDVMDIDVSITKIGNKSVHYHFDFSHEGREVATGQITCVCCQIDPGKPMKSVALPEEIKTKLEQYLIPSE